jgi:uncharacterized protein (DUF1697 family)
MNVGGRRITNDELVGIALELGTWDVVPFRASGNLVLSSSRTAEGLRDQLEAGFQDALGYEVLCVVRSIPQIRTLAAARPWDDEPKPQVALVRSPDACAREAALALATEDDRLSFVEDDLFWSPRMGVGRSKLGMRALERALGPFTVRTVGTLAALAKRA